MADYPPVKCPACKKRGEWLSGPYGPFCSKRCKLVDLGKWFNEEMVISEELKPDQMEEWEPGPQERPPRE